MAIYLLWYNQKPSNIYRKSKQKFGCGKNSKHRPTCCDGRLSFLRFYEHYIGILSLLLVSFVHTFMTYLIWMKWWYLRHSNPCYLYQRDLCVTFLLRILLESVLYKTFICLKIRYNFDECKNNIGLNASTK